MFDFELDPKILKEHYANKDKELEYIEWAAKRGSGEKPESLKLYNKYIKRKSREEPKTDREYLNDPLLREEVAILEEDMQDTKYTVENIFDVLLNDTQTAKMTTPLFYAPELEDELSLRVLHYFMVLNTIKTAHSITDAKIRATKETLETLGVDLPKELKIAIYVKEKYKKNQLKKAVIDAVKIIFPQITDKSTLELIATEALR